jgi:hypothetical protein
MCRTIRVGVAIIALGTSACGAARSTTMSAARDGASAQTPAATAAGTPLPRTSAVPAHIRLDFSKPQVTTNECDYGRPQPLAQLVQGAQAAIVAQVVAIGGPAWNSPDGTRPTQQQVDAMPVTVAPALYTPYQLRVSRVLHSTVPGLAQGITVTGYLLGGSDAFGDHYTGCVPTPQVAPGDTAVVFLGVEIDTGKWSPSGLHRPTVWEFDPIHNDQAMTMTGPQPVP